MSSNRKWLKICSFAQFILAIAAFIVAVIAVQSATDLPADATPVKIALVWSDKVLYAALGILSIVDSVMGIRGANRPSTLGSHRIIAVLAALVGIAGCVVTGTDTAFVALPAVGAIVSIVAAVLDTKVRKELDR